jgi:hypothetical protein
MLGLSLGEVSADLQAAINALLLKSPTPTSSDVASFLKPFAVGEPRNVAAQALLSRGVAPTAVSGALSWLEASEKFNPSMIWGILATVSMATSAFHGYRRNQSIGWALAWGVMGLLLPVITPTIAVAQGFGQRKAA